jgi:hypothetical protein
MGSKTGISGTFSWRIGPHTEGVNYYSIHEGTLQGPEVESQLMQTTYDAYHKAIERATSLASFGV